MRVGWGEVCISWGKSPYRRRHCKYSTEIEHCPKNWAEMGSSLQVKEQLSCMWEWCTGVRCVPDKERDATEKQWSWPRIRAKQKCPFQQWKLLLQVELESLLPCGSNLCFETGFWESLHHLCCPLGHGASYPVRSESVMHYWRGSFPMH